MGTFETLLELSKTYGVVAVLFLVLAALNGFFIWQGWEREKKMAQRISDLEAKIDGMIFPLLTEHKLVVQRATDCIAQNSRVLERLIVPRARS